MASQTSDSASFFEDELQCQICHNCFTDPRTLDCSHSFCLICLLEYVANIAPDPDDPSTLYVACPSCKMQTILDGGDASKLKIDLGITRLLECIQSLDPPYERVESYPPKSDKSGNMKAHQLSETCDEIAFLPLKSSGCEIKSTVASNQFPSDIDSQNVSLAISSERNTASDKTVSGFASASEERVTSRSESDDTDLTDGPANVAIKRICELHPDSVLDLYCMPCRRAICYKCKTEKEHAEHHVSDLQLQTESMRQELGTISMEANEALATVKRAIHAVSLEPNNKNSLCNRLDAIEHEIKASVNSMIKKIVSEGNELLEQLTRIRTVLSKDKLESLKQDIEKGARVAATMKKQRDAFVVVNTCHIIRKKLRKVTRLCGREGAIDRICDVSVQFKINAQIDRHLGFLTEEMGWQLDREILIPWDKMGQMQGMTYLQGEQLAVGYESGGVDIFNYTRQRQQVPSRLLEDVHIVDLVSSTEATIIAYPMYGQITEVTTDGRKLEKTFNAPDSSKHVALSRTADGRIYLAYEEYSQIHQFGHSGGNSLAITPTHDAGIRPQQIDITTSNKVVAKDSSGIRIMDLESQTLSAHIKIEKMEFAYSTCDISDNLYVAKVCGRTSRASIAKYSITGDFVESVSENVEVQKNSSGNYWLRLVSLSPSLLAVCDGHTILVYRRLPSIIELSNELHK